MTLLAARMTKNLSMESLFCAGRVVLPIGAECWQPKKQSASSRRPRIVLRLCCRIYPIGASLASIMGSLASFYPALLPPLQLPCLPNTKESRMKFASAERLRACLLCHRRLRFTYHSTECLPAIFSDPNLTSS